MEEQRNSLQGLFEKTVDYLETKAELVKLKAVDTGADMVSSFVARLVIIVIAGLTVVILNTGLAILLGELMGKMYYGFFTLGGFYLLLVIVVYAFRKSWLKKPLNDHMIKKILN